MGKSSIYFRICRSVYMGLLVVVLCFALVACSTPATSQPDPELAAAAMEGSETGAAVGVLTSPPAMSVYKWIGQALLQILINTKIDIKVDASTDAQKAPQ